MVKEWFDKMTRKELIEQHIKTHTVTEEMDKQAVSFLEYNLNKNGKIRTDFSDNDKWPNHDGTFEYIEDPNVSRIPHQNFFVQIKGTDNYKENGDVISYQLKSLGFPAYIANDVTLDPGILFIVLNPKETERQRIFWKYMSPDFISKIDFSKASMTIKFNKEDELLLTDDGYNKFYKKLGEIADNNLFIKKLDSNEISCENALKIIKSHSEDISSYIDNYKVTGELKSSISRKIYSHLMDICYSALILNAYSKGYSNVSKALAWDLAQLNPEVKYLANFCKGIICFRNFVINGEQYDRVMFKYYDYLWEIKKFVSEKFSTNILLNLNDYPKDIDSIDQEYYNQIAQKIEENNMQSAWYSNIYYIEKKNIFYINNKKYYEITLQLAGINGNKFNRITVYSTMDIYTNYSVQIGYNEVPINLFGSICNVKILTKWRVSIESYCINTVINALCYPIVRKNISRNYNEYNALMDYLTKTGISLLDLLKLDDKIFLPEMEKIYSTSKTEILKESLFMIRKKYIKESKGTYKYTARYLLLTMRREIIDKTIHYWHGRKRISSRCYTFEKNPYISNLPGAMVTNNIKNILDVTGEYEKYKLCIPYLKIKNEMEKNKELYIPKERIGSSECIKKYNESLDSWERNNGYMIKEKDSFYCIDGYEKNALGIIHRLIDMKHVKDNAIQKSNKDYVKQNITDDIDEVKKDALINAFVYSNVMLIYGAAGTGKTTLISYLSNMLSTKRKLFVAKTHTALQNVKRRIKPKPDDKFLTLDKITRGETNYHEFDLVILDECSVIDDRKMVDLLDKINSNALLVLSGDIEQLEPIEFGVWFYEIKNLIKQDNVVVELNNTWRTTDSELKKIWNDVRNDSIFLEELIPFSSEIDSDLFNVSNDEIILCQKYDGKFGINNINLYCQNINPNPSFYWNTWWFKVGDPIIFLENSRSNLLYNNLKGRICDIKVNNNSIIFELDIELKLTQEECKDEAFDYLGVTENGSKIRIEVSATKDDEEDINDVKTILPFQVAYAISIHKAQGLEYSSVKLLIPSNNVEITKSIFYTAITRAKDKLKIYWSSETMKKTLESFANGVNNNDESLRIIKKELGM